jgi:REP element-mobilizing transposase RayT
MSAWIIIEILRLSIHDFVSRPASYNVYMYVQCLHVHTIRHGRYAWARFVGDFHLESESYFISIFGNILHDPRQSRNLV